MHELVPASAPTAAKEGAVVLDRAIRAHTDRCGLPQRHIGRWTGAKNLGLMEARTATKGNEQAFGLNRPRSHPCARPRVQSPERRTAS